MPIIKSAIKRVAQAEVRTKRNNVVRRKYRELVKEFEKLVADKNNEEAIKLFPLVQKSIDLAAKKNVLHKNTAARKKSRLSKLISVTKSE